MIERFLTTEQVANILQVHPFTVLKFLKTGKIKGVKIGRVYRIKESDIHEFLEENAINNGHKEKKPAEPQNHTTERNEEDEATEHYYII